jgi:hypothetical protein
LLVVGRRGYRVGEIPVVMQPRQGGQPSAGERLRCGPCCAPSPFRSPAAASISPSAPTPDRRPQRSSGPTRSTRTHPAQPLPTR